MCIHILGTSTNMHKLSQIAQKYKLPIIAIGLGEKIDDLQIFDSKKFADAFIGSN